MLEVILLFGQDTMYFQKFDVENSDGKLYWHQYMQNIMAAQSEGATLKKTLTAIDALDYSYTFIIPVYENMPRETTLRPNTTNTNIEVGTDLVKINVTNSLKMRNEPNGSSIVGYLYKDEIATRIEKATTKVNGTYWDKILKSNGVIGYVARCTYDYESNYKEYLISIGTEHTNESSEKTSTDNSESRNSENNTSNETTENIADNQENNTSNLYNQGDVNCDGVRDSADLLTVKKFLLNKVDLTDIQKKLADTNNDNIIDSADLLNIKRFLLGKITL